jgi:hypothetical protein
MKRIEYVFMLLAVITTLASIIVNFKSGFTAYAWQLCTLLWIGTAYIKTERIKELEN